MRNCNTKIGIIGRIDPDGALYDGQTVKTRTIYTLMVNRYGANNVIAVDTKNYAKRALAVALDFIKCLGTCDDIVVSLSRNGRRAFFPALSLAARRFGKRVYHNLIGGWLADNLDEFPQWVGYLNSFEVNWVESKSLVAALSAKGVRNSSYLPNFKNLAPNHEPHADPSPPYRLCTFSRVVPEKGIGAAIQAVCDLNADQKQPYATLDVYGPVEQAYEQEFFGLVEGCENIRYCGCVKPEASVEAIKDYDALLFPTEWPLEGMPGTILDALFAGVPIVSSRWQCYSEMLEDGITGFSYELGKQDKLADTIRLLFSPEVDYARIRANCLARAESYSPESVFEVMAQLIERNRDRGSEHGSVNDGRKSMVLPGGRAAKARVNAPEDAGGH